MSKIAIIGGGPMGLTVAYELVKQSRQVELFEKEDRLGGMSAHFDFDGLDIEMYYHFVCAPDNYTLNLMKELGVYGKLKWTDTKMGFFYDGALYKWGGPFELLMFPKATLIEKMRYGLHIFLASKFKDWRRLDGTSSIDWIKSWEGQKGYDKFWDSLFSLKFYEMKNEVAAPWLWSRLVRVAKSRKNIFQERMGYISGGSQVLIDALQQEITGRGGIVHTNAAVTKINFDGDKVSSVVVNGEIKLFDKVISTIPLQYLNKLAPELPKSDQDKLAKLNNVGVVCVIAKLTDKLTDNFWLNIADKRMDIPGMIELSNLNTELREHILYVPFYLHRDNPKYSEPDENFISKVKRYINYVNPNTKPLDIRVFRYEYAQPLATLHFLDTLPPMSTDERKGFYFADTAYCYPEDRSIRESIRVAHELARLACE